MAEPGKSESELLAQLLAEQAQRWHAGEPLRVEEILAQHPALGECPGDLLRLIVHEFVCRQRHGEKPLASEFARRFPALSPRLLAVALATADDATSNSLDMALTVNFGGSVTDDHPTIEHSPSASHTSPTHPSRVSLPNNELADARYQEIRHHAAGGIGEIWIAADRQLPREVALKRIQDRHLGKELLQQQFVIEGQVTGLLEHPGVVPVYSLGTDARNEPFYAMRLIRGESFRSAIKRFHEQRPPNRAIERHNLEFRELLQRLIDVCHTIAYAHSRGVLHRDLKPDNVMLGKFGETYIIDWGMACILGTEMVDPSLATEGLLPLERREDIVGSQQGSGMGTPGYMSPEQATSEASQLRAVSDIYSLGAILYFLLTAQTPIKCPDITEFLRRVSTGEFAPPREVEPTAPAGLSAISLKAMALLPDDRYGSATALANDLERWLADEPLAAAPDTRLDRAARFARRHYRWLLPVVGAVCLLAATATIAAVLVNQARARAESAARSEAAAKERAEANFHRARQTVDQWLTGYTEALTDYPGVQSFRQQMLAEAAKQYESFVDEQAHDVSLQIEQGRTLLRLGDIRRQLFDPQAALVAYQRSNQLFARLANEPAAQQGLAESWGRIAIAQAESGNSEAAIANHRQAVALAQELSSQDAVREEPTNLLPNLLINEANYLAVLGKYAESTSAFEEAIAQLRRPVSATNRLGTSTALATAFLGLGQVQLKQAQANHARQSISEAVQIAQAVATLDELTPKQLELLATAALLRASVESQFGNCEKAVTSYRQAIDTFHALASTLPDVPRFREEAARTEIDCAQVWLKTGQLVEARNALTSAQHTLAELTKSLPNVPRFSEESGLALDYEAQAASFAGDDSEALAIGRQAVAAFEQLTAEFPDVPDYQYRLAVAESHLGTILASLEKFGEALASLERAQKHLPVLQSNAETEPYHAYVLATIETRRGQVLARAHNTQEADVACALASKEWKTVAMSTADTDYLTSAAQFFITCPSPEHRDLQEAQRLLERVAPLSPDSTLVQLMRAHVLLASAKPADAIHLLEGIQAASNDKFFEARRQLLLAWARHATKDIDGSQKAFKAALVLLPTASAGDWELRELARATNENLRPM